MSWIRIAFGTALALTLLALPPVAAAAGSEVGNPFASPAQGAAAGSAANAAQGAGAAGSAGRAAHGAGKAAGQHGKLPLKLTPAQRAQLLQQAAKNAKLSQQITGASNAATSTTARTQESSSGVNTSLILALVAAGLLLGGVAFVIVRDARSVAPVVEGMALGGTRNPEGRLRKRRAQAKAARRQRKRHRKR